LTTFDFLLLGTFWIGSALLGLIGVAMLIAGWELVRNDQAPPAAPAPRAHSIDVNLAASGPDEAAPATDSDARRRVLAATMARMVDTGPVAPTPQADVPTVATAESARDAWEETQPRVNLPRLDKQQALKTPPT
jgi:hypothetical protein